MTELPVLGCSYFKYRYSNLEQHGGSKPSRVMFKLPLTLTFADDNEILTLPKPFDGDTKNEKYIYFFMTLEKTRCYNGNLEFPD